jgi:hypothetical protein
MESFDAHKQSGVRQNSRDMPQVMASAQVLCAGQERITLPADLHHTMISAQGSHDFRHPFRRPLLVI